MWGEGEGEVGGGGGGEGAGEGVFFSFRWGTPPFLPLFHCVTDDPSLLGVGGWGGGEEDRGDKGGREGVYLAQVGDTFPPTAPLCG